MKNTTFFERIMQIIDFYNIKSVNSFAKTYLNYDSSERINRLKDENKKPSIEILEDISNKFEDVNIDWLVTGRGEMLRKNNIGHRTNGNNSPISGNIEIQICKSELDLANTKILYLEKIIKDKEDIIQILKNERRT